MDSPFVAEDNLLFRLRAREIRTPRPGAAIRSCRELYEYIVPNHTVHDVECPDHSIRKFTSDGQYLICFGRTQQEVIVYRYKGLGGPLPPDVQDDELPPDAKKFDAFFTRLYATVLVSNAAEPAQTLCKDFLLLAEGGELLICATSSQPDAHPAAARGALPGVPAMEVITLHLVRLADGAVVDRRVFCNDFIHLGHNAGVFLYDDLLAVLSVRFQCVHILQVREGAGRFVDVRTIGPHCREDDELVLQWQADAEARFQRDKARSRRRAGLAAPTAAKDNESDSPSDRVDADSARRAESADLEGDSETQALPARPRGGARSQGLEMRGGDDREPESEVVSVGGPGTSSFATFGVRLSKGDRPEGRPVRAYEWRESGVRGAVGAAGRAGGMLSILEERRRSHLAAGPSAPPTGGAFAAHFKRLPEGAREGARMSDEEMAARNAAAGHGELHARLEGLRQRLQAEQGGSAEVWRGDGLHDEDAAEGGAGPGEEAPQGEVSSRPQVGWKRDAENAGISHEWGGLHGYYAQAGKRGRLGWDGGVAGRLGKRDMSDMDECTSDFGQEGPAEVPGQEGAPAHRFPYGGGLLGGQAECAGGGEDVAGVKKDQAEPGAYPVWEQSDAAPMRLHGGAPTASHTVSYTESEEEEGEQTDTRETGTATAGLQADWRQDLRSTRGTGTSVVEHTPGVLQGPERGAGAALELPGWQGLRPPSAGWATGLQLPRAADEWETAHRQLPESGVGEEGLRGLAGGGTWMAPPDEEDDPMGRFSAVRPKSRHERMSAWEQAHWQLPDSDSGEERTQRRGRAGPGRIARGREAARAGGSSAPQLASDSGRDAGGSRWPPVTLYQPFGNGTQHRQAGGDGRGGIGLAQPRGGGQGSGGGGALAGLPNRTGAMVEAAGSDGARIRLAEGLGRGQARGQGQEEEDGVGLEGGVVYNIEDEDEGGGPTRVNSRLMSRSEGLGLRAGAPGMAGTAAAGSSPPLTHRSRGAGPARWEHTPPGEALQGAGAFRAGSAAVPRWPGQGLRTVHGGVYTSDLIEQLGRAFREAPRAADPPPGRRPLGPEWGAPLAPAEGPLWGTAPHPFFRREGGGLWNTPARSGFAHLHQAVGATRAPSTSSGGDDGEGRPGGRAASGGLLAAGRMAGLYSPYQPASAAPRYEYVVSSRTQSHTSSEPLDDVSMPTATSARHADGPARAPPLRASLLGGAGRSGPGLASGGLSAARSGRESQPGTSLAAGARPHTGVSPSRGRPQGALSGAATVTASGLSARPGSLGAAHSGEGAAPGASPAGEGSGDGAGGARLLGGLKQRLLSFIFRQAYEDEAADAAARAARLKRVFYHLQHYEELVMWKLQLLDRHHLLLKFGAAEGVAARGSDASTAAAFFAVYDMEATAVVGFFQNTSEALLAAAERFSDHFRAAPHEPAWLRFVSSPANSGPAREHLRKQKEAAQGGKPGGSAQVVKRALALLPVTCQSLSPSPYLDQSLFHYDEKLISAAERHKPCMEHPIKFMSRSRANALRFKIQPGPEGGSGDGRAKRVASYVFHPILPFAISIQQTYMQPPVINFHFRWPA